MELREYLIPLRRWWWLIVVSTLIAAVSSFFVTKNQPPVYDARTTLMVGSIIENPNPNQGEIYLAQSLAQTYADIAHREPVRNAAMQALDLTWLPAYQARALPQMQLIEIAVTDVNPQRAYMVANELANQLMLRSPTGSQSGDQEHQQFINSQLINLQGQIEETQDEIVRLQEELGTLNSARQLQDMQTQIAALQTKLTTLQGNYAALLANTREGATNTLTIIDPATLPTMPSGPNKGITIALSAAIGFSLAVGAAYILEYLDDTLKTPDGVKQTLGLPVIGLIAEAKDDGNNTNSVYVVNHPFSPISEAYRNLRTNLEFSEVGRPLRTIMVTSADAEAGKSSVAANLAVILAHTGKKVLLVDADLRRSSVHKYIPISNQSGLSDLIKNNDEIPAAVLPYWEDGKIWVIGSGTTPPNPSELLGSKRMEELLEDFKKIADIVIIDSPPLVVSDPLILAAKVDGILLVVRPGKTRKKVMLTMLEQLNRIQVRILGVVMNRIPSHSPDYYGGYLYSSPYLSSYPKAGEDEFEVRVDRRNVKRKPSDGMQDNK